MQPIFKNPKSITALLFELETWIGTPWAHMASDAGEHVAIKGVGGDCITIITTALNNAGLIEQLQFPGHIALPGLAGEKEAAHTIIRYLRTFIEAGRLQQVVTHRKNLLFGDLLAFRLGGSRAHHLGIYFGGRNGAFYHVPGPGYCFMLSALQESQYGAGLQSAYRLLEVPR